MQLLEIGERKLTEILLPTLCHGVGDDCAYITVGPYDLVVTTDPVPVPAAWVIGGDSDWYWAGRLLVTINASDLAAAGASPKLFVAAVECPAETDIADLKRLLQGISDACRIEGLEYRGGNLKEAKAFAATGTAVGIVPVGKGLHRTGAGNGDVLFSIGSGGEFWRDALAWREGHRFPQETSKLFAPQSQLPAMQLLRESDVITCSMDNSDGLLSTLDQLARVNGKHVVCELERLTVTASSASRIEQNRMWLGFGDWNVVVAVSDASEQSFLRYAEKNQIKHTRLGYFTEGDAGVTLVSGSQRMRAPRLESERFASDSWFSEGIEGYIKRLTALPLP